MGHVFSCRVRNRMKAALFFCYLWGPGGVVFSMEGRLLRQLVAVCEFSVQCLPLSKNVHTRRVPNRWAFWSERVRCSIKFFVELMARMSGTCREGWASGVCQQNKGEEKRCPMLLTGTRPILMLPCRYCRQPREKRKVSHGECALLLPCLLL